MVEYSYSVWIEFNKLHSIKISVNVSIELAACVGLWGTSVGYQLLNTGTNNA